MKAHTYDAQQQPLKWAHGAAHSSLGEAARGQNAKTLSSIGRFGGFLRVVVSLFFFTGVPQ
jgi:hypothetical protein